MKVSYNNELLWKREEIDWDEVPVGTKVLYSYDNKEWFEGYYLNYFPKNIKPHYILNLKRNVSSDLIYCKLVEEPKEEVTISEIEEEFHKVCKFNESEYACEKCKFKNGNNDSGCVTSIILSKYNVTRK